MDTMTFINLVICFCNGLLVYYIYNKLKNKKSKRSMIITYRNLYIGQGSNSYVYGLNEYSTQELAKQNQQCPPGYRWYSAIPSRRWV